MVRLSENFQPENMGKGQNYKNHFAENQKELW